MRVAAIDIGTNSVRLLVADCADRQLKEIFSDRKMTRLGERLSQNRNLNPVAIQRTVGALKSFYESIKQVRCDEIVCVATSAVREAENKADFISIAEKEVPLKIKVISGEEEARLTWIGISYALSPTTDYRILVDIGGGSVEWILADREKILKKISLPIGAVYLTDEFPLTDPPLPDEMTPIIKMIQRSLLAVKESFQEVLDQMVPITWIGTAGTVTTLAAMAQGLEKYSFEKINGFVLTREVVSGLFQNLVSRKKEDRIKIKGLEVGREDIILTGTLVLLETMSLFKVSRIVVSDFGLREGIIIDQIRQGHCGRDNGLTNQ